MLLRSKSFPRHGSALSQVEGLAITPDDALYRARAISSHASGAFQAAMLTIAGQRAQIASLRAKLAQAEETERRKSIVMATAGHDLRQPLHIVARALEILDPGSAEGQAKTWFDAATNQVRRMASGLSHLMVTSQQAGPDAVTPKVMSLQLADLLDDIDGDWRLTAAQKGIDLRIVRTTHQVLSDPRVLSTILTNLIGNAVKYSEQGRILVGCRMKGQSARIDIIDTGCGIAKNEIDRIFEPFSQCGPERGGYGMGLAIVQSLCRSIGHTLSVESLPNIGSRFSLLLPVDPQRNKA